MVFYLPTTLPMIDWHWMAFSAVFAISLWTLIIMGASQSTHIEVGSMHLLESKVMTHKKPHLAFNNRPLVYVYSIKIGKFYDIIYSNDHLYILMFRWLPNIYVLNVKSYSLELLKNTWILICSKSFIKQINFHHTKERCEMTCPKYESCGNVFDKRQL